MDLKIFSGHTGKPLAQEICSILHVPMGELIDKKHSDGEWEPKISGVRDADVYIINPTRPGEAFFDLALIARSAILASANRVTIIPTYLAYSRQDKKDQSGVPMAAQTIVRMLETTGAHRFLFVDLHSDQIMGFVSGSRTIPNQVFVSRTCAPKIIERVGLDNLIVCSPDLGGIKRARLYSKVMGLGNRVVGCYKERDENDAIIKDSTFITGDVRKKRVLLVDDMIDTAGTLAADTRALLESGATEVYAFATHGIFSGNAFNTLQNSDIKEIFISNTIPFEDKRIDKSPPITVISIAPLLAEAIQRLHTGKQLAEMISY